MTNKEKASELTLKLEGEIGTSPHSRQAIEETLIEMAEWKDQQFEDMKEKIKVDTKIEIGYEIREKICNGASITSLDAYARNLCKL